jgi:SulP family sulfate permease
LSGVFASAGVIMGGFILAPLLAFLPRAALGGVLLVAAYSMINQTEIRRTIQASAGDTRIMLATFAAALMLPLQYAVLTGVLVSFIRYIYTTSTPAVLSVLPDESFRHFEIPEGDQPACPQLGVLTPQGSLYFGAVHHVEEQIRAHMDTHPEQKFLLLRMHHINHCDMTGVHMLEAIVRLYRQQGGDVFMMRVHTPVMERMQQTGFDHMLGHDHFLAPESSISYLFNRVLDPAICIYSCQVRAWKECQALPKSYNPSFVPLYELEAPHVTVPNIEPGELWQRQQDGSRLMIIDVREMGEWQVDGFISDSHLVPLPRFFEQKLNLPPNCDIILVSRTGRRSRHLTSLLQRQGWNQVYNLHGGFLGWRSAYLPVETVSLQESGKAPDENAALGKEQI